MQSTAATKENRRFLDQIIDFLPFFSLSDKFKFAVKTSLSITLAYLIPMYLGWENPGTVAVTVFIIASMDSVGSSVKKGMFRVIGTIVGAVIGMTLIAIFPQERLLYLISLSLFVVFFFYLARAFKGDITIFMLTGLTMILVFKYGAVDDIFTYGVERTMYTIFGIVIYTIVGIFLWPVNVEENSVQNAVALTSTELDLYRERDAEKEKRQKLYQSLISQEALLNTSNLGASDASGEIGFTTKQWLDRDQNLYIKKGTSWGALKAKYSQMHIMNTVKKMQFWASLIDTKHFNTVDKEQLMKFTKESEEFVYMLKIAHRDNVKVKNNTLIKTFTETHKGVTLADLLSQYASGREVKDIDCRWKDEKHIMGVMENNVETFLSAISFNEYSRKEIVEFYESVNLINHLWLSFFNYQNSMTKIDFKALEANRF